MKTYRVGGAVRDELLGLPVQDIDYVVIGSTPEEMITAGYTPVGKDFPVFLHPTSKAEYALARTERKSAPGYHGFVFHCAPEVTLEQDLQRRDLTINAMARAENPVEATEQTIVDPFGGQRDLAAKVFRHVSAAFAEDPVRILRVARLSARLNQFGVAPETMQLMRSMVDAGEVDALVPERVWQEMARGLMESHPSRMLTVLHECRALARIIPEFDSTWIADNETDTPLPGVLDFAAQQGQTLAVRWAAACIAWSNFTQQPRHNAPLLALCQRLKVPADMRDIALIASREHAAIHDVASLSATQVVELLERCDAIRRPSRFAEIISAVRCSYLRTSIDFVQQDRLERALTASRSIPAEAIAKQTARQFPNQKEQIAEQIFAARVAAVKSLT